MPKIIKLQRRNPKENEAIQYRPGEILDIINWLRDKIDDIKCLEICILDKHAHKISLNINGDATVIYAFDYIAYDREWCEPYIGRLTETTLKERYGIEKC